MIYKTDRFFCMFQYVHLYVELSDIGPAYTDFSTLSNQTIIKFATKIPMEIIYELIFVI